MSFWLSNLITALVTLSYCFMLLVLWDDVKRAWYSRLFDPVLLLLPIAPIIAPLTIAAFLVMIAVDWRRDRKKRREAQLMWIANPTMRR